MVKMGVSHLNKINESLKMHLSSLLNASKAYSDTIGNTHSNLRKTKQIQGKSSTVQQLSRQHCAKRRLPKSATSNNNKVYLNFPWRLGGHYLLAVVSRKKIGDRKRSAQ